jgi:hypothetical protein
MNLIDVLRHFGIGAVSVEPVTEGYLNAMGNELTVTEKLFFMQADT